MLRTLVIAASTSLGLVVYLSLWFHWPLTLSLAVAALLGMLVLATSASLGEDPAAADAAWRAAAPDLLDQPGPALAPSPSAVDVEGDEAAGAAVAADGVAAAGIPGAGAGDGTSSGGGSRR